MASEPTAPDFVLRLVDGRGVLGLRTAAALPVGRLECLELEVPNLRFPFDAASTTSRFRNRRCTVREAMVRIDDEQLSSWLETRSLARYGIDELRARITGERIALAGAITVGERRAPFTCALSLSATKTGGLSIEIESLCTYAALPAPAPLVGLALLYGLGARPEAERGPASPPGFTLRGIDRMEADALALALWRTLLPWGWRLPKLGALRLPVVAAEARSLTIRFAPETSASTRVDTGFADPALDALQAADLRLADNDLAAALSAYEQIDDLRARDRRLAVLAVLPQRRAEAIAIGEMIITEDPMRGGALTQLGTLYAEAGDVERAFDLFQRVAVLAERAGEPAAAIEAALRAAELILPVNAEAATPLLERVVAGRPAHQRAAALLAARYAAEGRPQDLLRLEKKRLSYARGQREEAAARLRLGAVWLEHHDDALRARDELERALRLFPGDADTFRLYARTLERTGDLERALDATEQAIAAADATPASRRTDRLAAAALADRLGRADAARRHAEDLLEENPGDPDGLHRLAQICGEGELHDAISAYERAAAAVDDDAARAQLYYELAKLCQARGASDRARTFFDRAHEVRPSLEILQAAAALADAEHRVGDLLSLLERLGELGDRTARLRRARLLVETGRPTEAAAEGEALATLGDPEALAVVVEARRAEGKPELLAAALERFVEVRRDAAPRVELSRLRAADGDLVRARILLEEALSVISDGQSGLLRDALEVLCDVLLRQGDDASLEGALGRLAALRPEPAARARALAAQGAARARMGRLDAALGSYREAVAADEGDDQARVGLAETAYVLRLWDEARSALEPLFRVSPRADRASRLGEIAERQGRPADAIQFYEAALQAGAAGNDAHRIYVALAALHHARGDWEAEARVLVTAAEDARTTDTDVSRAGRLVQAADLLRKRVARVDEAMTLYDRALALDPMCLPALDALESIAMEREDWSRAAQILSRKVAATSKRTAEQKAILGRLAVLQAQRLGREDAAREAYTRALAIDPHFRPALIFLARDARARGDRAAEREQLERLAQLPADPAEPEARLGDLFRLGQLYLEEGRVEETEATARRLLSEQPRHPGALALLDEVFSRSGRAAELEGLLAIRAQIEPDHDAGVELLLRRAGLLEEAGRYTDAIAAYEHVTGLHPASAAAWRRLTELLRRTESWAPLAVALGRLGDWHASAGRREEAVALYVEQAHVLHDQLGQPEGARHVLERARETWPASRLVLGALLALARARNDRANEAALLDQLVDLESDPGARAQAILERARSLAQGGDREGALRRLREISPSQASEALLRLRVELEELNGSLPAAIESLERLRQLAESAGDAALERYALQRLLRIAREQTPARAEPIAARLATLDPDDREALRVMAESAQRRLDPRGQIAALERLLEATRRKFEGQAAEAALAVELADLARLVGEPRTAELRLREAAEAVPNDGGIRRALGLLLLESGADVEGVTHLARAAELGALSDDDQLRLADAYEHIGQSHRAATAVLAAGERASASRRAIAASRLGDEALARAAALQALALSPDDEEVIGVLLRGLSAPALIAQLEELAPRIGADRAAALLERRAAGLAAEDARLALERALSLAPTASRWLALAKLSEGAAAHEAYGRAFALDPGSVEAALGRASGSPPDEARAVLRQAFDTAVTRGGDASVLVDRARLGLRLGELARDRGELGAARQAFAAALEDASAATKTGQGALDRAAVDLHLRAARALAATARVAGDVEEAEAALGALVDAGAATDIDLRMLAELLLERDAVADALEVLEGLEAPGELYAIALERAGSWTRLVEHLSREASSRPPDEARPLLLRAASLCTTRLDDPARAVALLERALPLGPTDAEIWERIGTLLRERLQEPTRGAHALARAYGADPSRTHLLLPLADFHHDAGETAPARDYYGSLLAAGAAPAEALPRVHLRLAEYARAAADAIEEEHHLRAAVALRPEQEAWRRLIEIYRVREDKLRLEQALLALADAVAGPERLSLLREARMLQGPAPSAELDERILALDPDDGAARFRALERLRRAEDPSAFLEHLEREVDAAEARGSLPADLPLELGRLGRARGDLSRAVRGFRLALERDPSDEAAEGLVATLQALGRIAEAPAALEQALATATSDEVRHALEQRLLGLYLELHPPRALQLVEAARARGARLELAPAEHRRLLRAEGRHEQLMAAIDEALVNVTGDERLPLEMEAAEVLAGPLARPRDAAARLAALAEAFPGRRDLSARARALYMEAGEPIYALALVDRELATASAEELPQLKITRGELLLAAGADADAEAEFLHALITTKRVGRAHAALADVYRKRGDLASALEHLIAAADAPDLEPSRAAACAVDAADVLLIEGDTATAERLYQLATALDPADRRALDALIRLAAAQAAFDRQAELLGRAAALTADRRERARLLHERARLFETELGRDLDAYRAYREAVACDPTLRDAVRALRLLAEARGEWAVVAEQLYREIALCDSDADQARLHLRLAQIHEERLFDAAAALRNLEQAASLWGEAKVAPEEQPWPALSRLYAEGRRYAEAAAAADRVCEQLPEDATPEARVEALQRSASLWGRAGDDRRAAERRDAAAQAADHDGLQGIPVDAPPEVQRRAIEQRLRAEPEGERRVVLLRKLVALLAEGDETAELDTRATELLRHAPDDAAGFAARRRVVEAGRDPAALAALLRTRAGVTSEPHERAELRWEAGRITETQLYDVAAAAIDYEAALDAEPDHLPALEALADLAFRTRHLQRARTLYERLGDRASSIGVDEVARRRGELAEEAGDFRAALEAYAAAAGLNPSNLAAQQAIARVSMRLEDDRGAYQALRAVLELLPREAVDRVAELRRHLGELAARLGELEDARIMLEAVLLEDPRRRDVLATLNDVYERSGAFDKAAELYARRALMAERADDRAELLFRQGEALSAMGDHEAASDAYLKAADLDPRHAPTLRRLVRHYLSTLDLEAMVEVVAELEALSAPLAEAALDAALGIALKGDEARGAIVAALAQPTPAAIAEVLRVLPWPPPPTFEAALRTALRGAGGAAQARDPLIIALEAHLGQSNAPNLRFAAAVLLEQAGRVGRARVHLEILSYSHPNAIVDTRLAAIPPQPVPEPTLDQIVAADARGPLREALCDLGPLALGLAVAPLDVESSAEAAQRVAPVVSLFGYASVEVGVLDRLADPAWAEPTRPPRLLLQRRLVADPGAARFAAARALHALHAGLGLIHGRSADDIAALLRGAASLFLPDLRTDGPFVRAWQAELSAMGLRPEALPDAVRGRLEVTLANLLVDRTAAEHAAAYAEAERLTANRVAYVVTGDLRAGLVALGPTEAEERARAVVEDPVLADLVAFALLLYR